MSWELGSHVIDEITESVTGRHRCFEEKMVRAVVKSTGPVGVAANIVASAVELDMDQTTKRIQEDRAHFESIGMTPKEANATAAFSNNLVETTAYGIFMKQQLKKQQNQ